MQTKPRIPEPPVSPDGAPKLNGHVNPHQNGNVALLSLLAAELPHVSPKPQPFLSPHHGEEARLAEEIRNRERQREEARAERTQLESYYTDTPKFLKLDKKESIAVGACAFAIAALSGLSWFNGAQFVEKNFTESFFRGLLFCGAIPAIPFIFKFFFLRFAGRSRLLMEFVLLAIFLIGFFVFADQFGQHFARKPGLDLAANAFDFGGTETAPLSAVPTASGPISLRYYFFGQLILEITASFVFFSWLLLLLTPRLDPDREAAGARIVSLNGHLPELDRIIAELYGRRAELEHQRTEHNDLKSALIHLFK